MRRFVFSIFVLAILTPILLLAISHWNQRRIFRAAERDFPIAQTFLARDAAFSGVKVEIDNLFGIQLSFWGTCDTQEAAARLESEIRRQFGNKEYMLAVSLKSQADSIAPNTSSTLTITETPRSE